MLGGLEMFTPFHRLTHLNAEILVKYSDPQSHRPQRIPITKKHLSSVRSAHAANRQKCKREREEEELKKKEKEKEQEFARRQQQLKDLKAKNESLLEKEVHHKYGRKWRGRRRETNVYCYFYC